MVPLIGNKMFFQPTKPLRLRMHTEVYDGTFAVMAPKL